MTPNAIHGLWGGTVRDSAVNRDVRLRIAENVLELSSRCKFADGQSVLAYVKIKIRISERTLTFLEAAEDVKATPDGKNRCYARAEVRDFTYVLDGTKLVVGGDLHLVKLSD